MSDLRAAIKLITGKEADEQQIQRLMAIAQALGIPQNDAMMPILGMLESYNRLYTNLPGEVARQCKSEAESYAKASAISAQGIVSTEIAKTMSGLVEAAKQGIITASESAAEAAKADAVTLATKIALGGLLAAALVFTGLGYGIRSIAENLALKDAQSTLAGERETHAAEIKRLESSVKNEMDALEARAGWIGSEDGAKVAGCKLEGWRAGRDKETGKPFCIVRQAESSTFGKDVGQVDFWMPTPKKK